MPHFSSKLVPYRTVARPARQEIVLPLGPPQVAWTVTPFDQPHYRALIQARGAMLRKATRKLMPALGLSSAVDAGCGVGFFAQTLAELGLTVCGFDGRRQNVEEARRRFPAIPFETADIEDPAIQTLGKFDLVFCFGLLYHVENPFRAIRSLRGLTGKCLLLESMVVPGEQNELLLREEPRVEDQSLTDVACYPSENALVKMLYRAGFAKVYRVTPLPDHDDFRETSEHGRKRTMLLASLMAIDLAGFRLMPELGDARDPWSKTKTARPSFVRRAWRFAKSPARAKYVTLALRVRRRFPQMAIPLRLPVGVWWLAEDSVLDGQLLHGDFEAAELRFEARFLTRGMTVVDIGAHHGLHTLLASKKAGKTGRVLAFEPSQRERQRLVMHLRFNRCRNVEILPYALGRERAQADIYMAEGGRDFCNSLRIPDVPVAVQTAPVEVRRLDEALEERGLRSVDFVKLDVEGGELDVLEGAGWLLERRPRPVMLVEVEDRRTRMWGYRAKEIVRRLEDKRFIWHSITRDGRLERLDTSAGAFEGNYVAVPTERMGEMEEMMAGMPSRRAEEAATPRREG